MSHALPLGQRTWSGTLESTPMASLQAQSNPLPLQQSIAVEHIQIIREQSTISMPNTSEDAILTSIPSEMP